MPYTDAEPVRDAAPDEIVVGHIAAVRAGLRALGLAVPAELGYPEALRPFLGRRLWPSTINAVAAAKFLSARWAQLSGTPDYADF